MKLADWLERYRRAWEEADADGAAALFTEDALYRSSIFADAHEGRAAIRAYWTQATAAQRAARVVLGSPVAEGRRVAVEWWTTMEDDGEEMTLPGCLLLRFAEDGLCEELREYWHLQEGLHDPPRGWGH